LLFKIRNDVIITTGVGQHQMWAAQFYRWSRPHSIITSGGLGTMGFGLPAALGAKVAKPDHLVRVLQCCLSFYKCFLVFFSVLV
jgi:acetolactate synthase-1/2/3 large subunit